VERLSRRYGRGRLTWAGSRETPAPSMSARWAWLGPVGVMRPCRRRCPRSGVHRGQAEIVHELRGVGNTGAVPAFGHGRYCPSTLHTPQDLAGLNHWGPAPRVHLDVACLRQALEVFSRHSHHPDICLEDALFGGSGANDLRKPAPVGWWPSRVTGRADSRPQEHGVEPLLGRLEVADGLFTGAPQVPQGVVFARGDRDLGENPRAPEPGQLAGVSPVGVDPSPGLFRHQRGRNHLTALPWLRQLAVPPRAARAGVVDNHEGRTRGLERGEQHIDVPRPRPDGAEGDDLSTRCLDHIGDRQGVLLDSESNVERVRRGHG
jgi:hypothetical protein